MARTPVLLATLTISISATNSALSIPGDQLGHYGAISIAAPSTLAEAVAVQVGLTNASNAAFNNLQLVPGSDCVVSVGKTLLIPACPFLRLRVGAQNGTSAAAADRIFLVHGYVNPVTSP